MARRRRLTPAQPGYTVAYEAAPVPASASAVAPGLPGGAAARVAPIAQVSGQSAEAAALREMAEGIQAARDEGRMIVDVPLIDVSPGYLMRDRIAVDREALDALKDSIRIHGQRAAAEIIPLQDCFARETDGETEGDATGRPAYRFGLISGWRRLMALNELHAETGDVRFSTLRAVIRQSGEAAESYVAMIEENEIRVGLSYYERARMVAELAARGVFADQSAALRTLFASASRAKRSKIASFIDIHEGLGDLLRFPADIPERLGLALVAKMRLGGRRDIRRALDEHRPTTAAAELALLEKLTRPAAAPKSARTRAESERFGPELTLSVAAQKPGRMTLTLTGSGADAALLDRIRALLRQGRS